MENPYKSPESNVEIKVSKIPRPKVVYYIAAIFSLFMVCDSILAYIGYPGREWIFVSILSFVLLFIPWALLQGKSWAVTRGLIVFIIMAFLNIGGIYEVSEKYPVLQRNLFFAEGVVYLGMALVLYKLRNHDFFKK